MNDIILPIIAPCDETEDTTSQAAAIDHFCSPAGAGAFGGPPMERPTHDQAEPTWPVVSALLDRGRIMLNPAVVRRLREARRLSQQDLADDCWRRNFRISIATIKRVETGHPVRFRIAREFARYFDVQF